MVGQAVNQLSSVSVTVSTSGSGGRTSTPSWITPDISSNASANSDLVTKTVSSGKRGYIYGWEISSEDTSNNFTVNWTSGGTAKTLLIIFGGSGNAVNEYTTAALNEGLPADAGTNITIKNTVAAQTAKRLQARILYVEV